MLEMFASLHEIKQRLLSKVRNPDRGNLVMSEMEIANPANTRLKCKIAAPEITAQMPLFFKIEAKIGLYK